MFTAVVLSSTKIIKNNVKIKNMRQNFSEPIVCQAFYNKYSRKCSRFVIILKQTSQQIQLMFMGQRVIIEIISFVIE